MKKFATHMTWVLVFLSFPLEVVSMTSVEREAASKNVTADSLLEASAKIILDDMTKVDKNDMECHCLDTHYLNTWTEYFIDIISRPDHFEKFGSKDMVEKKEYTEAMEIYWKCVKTHCVSLAQNPPKDIDPESETVIKYMVNKIEWLRSGRLTATGPKFLTSLPLPNKFLLSDILKLYSNTKFQLDTVIIDVSNPLVIMMGDNNVCCSISDDHFSGANGQGCH